MQQRRVTLIRRVRVARDVRRPLVLGRVRVARADVFVLERLELLLGAEFVGLWRLVCWSFLSWPSLCVLRVGRYHFDWSSREKASVVWTSLLIKTS